MAQETPEVRPAEFSELPGAQAPTAPGGSLQLLLDIHLPVTVELGRTRLSVREILQLGPGSVIPLDRLAGEPVDVLVSGTLVARGEVVVVDENFGIRISEIVTNRPADILG
jgi:flagellar motor switch protein FliN/FliY